MPSKGGGKRSGEQGAGGGWGWKPLALRPPFRVACACLNVTQTSLELGQT